MAERIKREVPYSLKMTKEERTLLNLIAAAEQRPDQEMLRELIRAKARELGLMSVVAPKGGAYALN